MANFVQGDASPIANIQPWTPDWSFLENVYGVTQQRYDRGFNMVKSLYNSVLNSKVTNSQNSEFRNSIFQKLQSSLRNVAGLDLSNPTNVATAKSLLDPITEDKELAYDMYVTRHHDAQKQTMESYKNSTDVKLRSLYSDYSKMDIGFAEDDLRKAKRGDGSITAVQPRDFTPFEDVSEYLNLQAEKAKLKIVTADTKGGYILTQTNGKPAEQPFAEWAAIQMGTRFDRQFQVMGRVKAENEIRGLMQEKNITRQEAETEVGSSLATKYLDSQTRSLDIVEDNLTNVTRSISQYDKKFPNGIPSSRPDLQQEYNNLLQSKQLLEGNQKSITSEIDKLKTDGSSYIMSNIHGIYTNQAKKTAANNWGSSRAETTSEMDIKPDQKVISDWDRAAENARNNARLNQAWKIHQDDMANKKLDREMKERQFQVTTDLAIAKAKGKGELPTDERVGTMVGTKSTGVEILSNANSKNKAELFNNTFGANTGLINLVLDKPEDHGKYYSVVQKLNSIANGSTNKLSTTELATLSKYAKLVGYRGAVPNVNSIRGAYAFMTTLTGNTYRTAVNSLGTLSKLDANKSGTYIQSFERTVSAMRNDLQQQKQIDKSYKSIAATIYDYNTGTVKKGYEGAKIIGKLSDGTPIFNLQNISEAKKEQLNKVVGGEFSSRVNPVGSTYKFTKPSGAELYNLFQTSNTIKVYSSTGEKLNAGVLMNLPDENLKKLFGDQLNASFDPGSKMMTVKVKINTADAVAKQLKLQPGEFLKVKIPYSMIESNASLTRFQKYAKHNSVNPDSYGILEGLSRNKFTTVHAPEYMEKSGYDFTLTGTTNGSGEYGVNLVNRFYNPSTKKWSTDNTFYKINHSDPNSIFELSEIINAKFTRYQTEHKTWQNQY